MSDLRKEFAQHTASFVEIAEAKPFVVFLCGHSLDPDKASPAAQLRERIKAALEQANFSVVLGEDSSIDNDSLKGIGINVQDSELIFVANQCNAIVIVADSVGSFCELGLFSWHFCHDNGIIENIDFILLIDEKYKSPPSYLNQGPARAVDGHGRLDFVNFETFDAGRVVEKLKSRRGTYVANMRGRPRKAAE